MLRIVQLEEIHGLLLRIPALIDDLAQKDPAAIGNVRGWLVALEQALQNNRLPLAGSIAALRGSLDSALKGAILPGIVFHGQTSGRQIREATATDILKRACDLVTSTIQADGARIDEAQRVTRQLIAVGRLKGLVPTSRPPGDPIENVRSVWSAMQSDAEMAQGAAHLVGLVGPHDALVVIDRGLASDAWGR